MGLQEKKAWAAVQEEMSGVLKRIHDASGKEIKVTFDNDSFEKAGAIESITYYATEPLVIGIQQLCGDELAKEAFANTISAVHLIKTDDSEFKMSITKDVLNVHANFNESGMSGIQYPHQNDYETFLTKNL